VLRDGKKIDSCETAVCTTGSLARMMVGREVTMKPDRAEAERAEARLALKNLCAQSDREMPALRGVDLKVHSGEILGLAGVSGNGQRELAEVITGLRPATEGQVFLEGEDVTGYRPGELTELMLAYIPEERMKDGMIQEFSVAENMILREHHKEPFSRSGFLLLRIIAEYADKLIKKFQVKTPSRDTPAKSLSGGNSPASHVSWSPPNPRAAWTSAPPNTSTPVSWSSARREPPSCSSRKTWTKFWGSRTASRSSTKVKSWGWSIVRMLPRSNSDY
jgi:ABC-type uncharacterized transport system ATPase subunit